MTVDAVLITTTPLRIRQGDGGTDLTRAGFDNTAGTPSQSRLGSRCNGVDLTLRDDYYLKGPGGSTLVLGGHRVEPHNLWHQCAN